MKPRVIYVQNGATEKPSVRITHTKEGITFSVQATGRSLTKARQRAEQEFRALAAFVKEQEKA